MTYDNEQHQPELRWFMTGGRRILQQKVRRWMSSDPLQVVHEWVAVQESHDSV